MLPSVIPGPPEHPLGSLHPPPHPSSPDLLIFPTSITPPGTKVTSLSTESAPSVNKTPGKKKGKNDKTPRIRSFGGCFTCRARKVKCDERHPECRQCDRSGLACAGYEAKIRFILYGKNGTVLAGQGGHDGGHGRRILFTEDQRQRMSEDMKKAVRNVDLDTLLNTVEVSQDEIGSGEEVEGPFSVFNITELKVSHPSISHHEQPALPRPTKITGDKVSLDPVIHTELLDLSPSEPLILNTDTILVDLGQALAHSPRTSHATVSVSMSHSMYSLPDTGLLNLQSIQFPTDLLHIDGTASTPMQTVNSNVPVDNIFHLTRPPSPLAVPMFNTLPSLGSSIHMHSHFLLDHYKSQMGKLFSPLRARKPPWSILHFPRALTALSELSVFKTLNHAHMSLLYSVLAVSAFNWDNIHSGEAGTTIYWRQVGDLFRLGAKQELELAGEWEMVGEKSAKYKDILMAILTMVTISVVSGQQDEARSFILNAELFICVRGIQKPRKSRKIKLLHCIYLYIRVIEESTYAYPLERQPVGNLSVPLRRMLFPSLRTNSLCVGRNIDQQCSTNFEQGLFKDAVSTSGDSDSDPRFFVEIYGIPHQILSFISRATFLANEINMLRRRDPEATMTFNLEASCRQLEDELCGWKYHGMSLEGDEDDPLGSFANQTIMPHLVRAFHCATLIFFYRRVREVHPFILQNLVQQAIESLEGYNQEQRNFMTVNCSVAWPGFIAGAEAMDGALQERYLKQLEADATTSGMMNFSTSAAVLREFWKFKREGGGPTYQWIDFVRMQQISLVLT